MFNLNKFLNSGIKNIFVTAKRFYLDSGRGRSFILGMAAALRKSAKIRRRNEKNGLHIPTFLIASIAANCNLRCAGCYARANGGCAGEKPDEVSREEMRLDDWRRVFSEASELGISFVLLAGGEPLLRRDIITLAAQFGNIIFPVFTNGTMLDEEYITLFDSHRNLIPVLSIEGSDEQTDKRRGQGVSKSVWDTAGIFRGKGLLYGVSITVTNENKNTVTSGEFVRGLRERGCALAVYVEYVPAEKNTEHLILNNAEQRELQTKINALRAEKQNKGTILVAFPGDEEAMGGCLAAGRGFFHINANGGAEPCPFSPYSEMNLKKQSVADVLRSPFFGKVREISAAEALTHAGGCTLFQYEKEVKQALG